VKKRKTVHYVDNKAFYTAIVQYRVKVLAAKEAGVPIPRMPNYIGDCLYKIATNLALKPNFAGYSFREELIGDALENAIQYFHNFNPEKSTNPFAYFTQLMWFAFLRRIHREQKESYVKQKVMRNSAVFGSNMDEGFLDSLYDVDNDKSNEIIEAFEKKLNARKVKKVEE
jgi:hypothetical protein